MADQNNKQDLTDGKLKMTVSMSGHLVEQYRIAGRKETLAGQDDSK